MDIYHYDPITKEYTGATKARLDPLELEINKKEVWLLPACATFDAPPTEGEGVKIIMSDAGWNVVPIPPEPEPEPTPEPTVEEKQEILIQAEMQRIIREQAIANLKAEGKI